MLENEENRTPKEIGASVENFLKVDRHFPIMMHGSRRSRSPCCGGAASYSSRGVSGPSVSVSHSISLESGGTPDAVRSCGVLVAYLPVRID